MQMTLKCGSEDDHLEFERLYVEQYCLIQTLCGGMDVTDNMGVTDITDVTDIVDITGHCGSYGHTDTFLKRPYVGRYLP